MNKECSHNMVSKAVPNNAESLIGSAFSFVKGLQKGIRVSMFVIYQSVPAFIPRTIFMNSTRNMNTEIKSFYFYLLLTKA